LGQTIAEKILAGRSGQPDAKAGDMVVAKVDCAMLDDILGPRFLAEQMDRLTERFGADIWDRDRVVVVSDHYTPSGTASQANIVKFTRDWAARHRLSHYFEGLGPCHQILAENGFDVPGTLQVGTDSHTCTAGAFGCLGTGIGTTEMLSVLLTGEIWLRVPESIDIQWHGKLPEYVMAKDIALRSIGETGHSGATYMSMEFSGGAVTELTMDERMCVANMAVEAGAKCGLMAADGETDRYLEAIGRGERYTPVSADGDAVYAARYSFDAGALAPQVACPHEVDNVFDIDAMDGTPIRRVYIGSCTGGRMSDLEMAARLLKGKKVDSGCKLLVSPASQKIWLEAVKKGVLETLAEAGATILAPTCGACLGVHSGVIADGECCVSTTNRNFKGRMGSPEGKVYLASAATAAATALHGRLSDPRKEW
jgi:3-isopropylmalate/(R)-2-methylmalate dehydratase large subunit